MFSIVLFGSCQKDIEGCTDATAVNYNPDANIDNSTCQYVPTLSTKPIIYDSLINAESGGVITSDGGSEITVRGICWGTSPNPTIANDTTIDGSGTGSFSSFITNLNFSSTYYVRAYATNSNGTGYGDEIIFTTINITIINDQNFEQALIDLGYDNIIDGYINSSMINNVDTLRLINKGITDLTGIEGFISLKFLDVSENNELSVLDLSGNLSLTDFTYVPLFFNQLISEVDISNNTLLEKFEFRAGLNSIDLTNNISLTYLSIGGNQLTSLDVSNNTALTTFICSGNQLTSLDVSQNTALTELWCNSNQLTSLDVSQNTALTDLQCSSNQLTSLDVSQNTALTLLACSYNQLTCLNLKNGNNQNMIIGVDSNPNLGCIEVDDPAWSTTNWWAGTATFSTNCNYPAGCF